ncbi:hypothetical protein [Herbaspirillum sp. RV1423]|uniref:hypothetical protein n=1 Tax=Herbaspirillum sp. RV1423 TaxID=1443993 RepID=UPI0012DD8FE1|nr:hypothetical protein [Herbaspirillum sp. RV1423]
MLAQTKKSRTHLSALSGKECKTISMSFPQVLIKNLQPGSQAKMGGPAKPRIPAIRGCTALDDIFSARQFGSPDLPHIPFTTLGTNTGA